MLRLKPSSLSFPNHLWICFALFLFSNTYLAFGAGSLEVKLWVGLIGIVLPFFVALFYLPRYNSPQRFLFSHEIFSVSSNSIFVFLFLSAAFLRLYQFQSLSVWPMWDDGHYSYFAINLSEKWHWQLFFGSEQYMPIYTILQGLYYKCVEPSLNSMWLFPILVSIPILPIAYLTVRQYFPRSFSITYLCLLSFSFWPIYITRFSNDINLCIFWEYGAFLIFGLLLKAIRLGKKNSPFLAGILGLMTGIGWLVSKFWLSNILVFFFLMFYFLDLKKYCNRRFLFLFIGCAFLSFSPMLWLILTGRYGSHIYSYSLFLAPTSGNPGNQWAISLSYFTDLLWGSLTKVDFHFGPLWGGLLNPILGSAFLLGLVETARQMKFRFLIGASFLFLFYLLQGVMSNSLEIMRIVPFLPILLLVVGIGLQYFFSLFRKRRMLVIWIVLFLSLSLDIYHIWGPYHTWAYPHKSAGESKPPEQFRAYQILREVSRRQGPGLILSDFVPDVFNQTLLISTYPFNAARNPKYFPSHATWAGVIALPTYQSFFSRLFPSARSYNLSKGLDRHADEMEIIRLAMAMPADLETKMETIRSHTECLEETMLWVIPIDKINKKILLKWVEAHKIIQPFFKDIPYHVANPSYSNVIQELFQHEDAFVGDPFLESCFYSKIAKYSFNNKNYDLFAQSAKKVIKSGFAPDSLFSRLELYNTHLGSEL